MIVKKLYIDREGIKYRLDIPEFKSGMRRIVPLPGGGVFFYGPYKESVVNTETGHTYWRIR